MKQQQEEKEKHQMKKKSIALLAGALLVAGTAGNALAANFADGDLIEVVYNGTANEYATDLGSIASLAAATNGTVIAGGTLPTATAGYNVAYFAFTATSNSDATNQLWVSNTATSVKNNYKQWSTSVSGLDAAISGYQILTPNANGTVSQAAAQPGGSYFTSLDAGGTNPGSLGGIVATSSTTETTLAGAATQGIYYFANPASSTTSNHTATLAFDVTTNADGTITLGTSNAPAATPIPPAFFLMGSGLLGMFGLRRKKA